MLRGVFNIVHYILTNRNIPQFYDVSHEILILYNSLYIHINKQKMVHYWYMNGTRKNLMHGVKRERAKYSFSFLFVAKFDMVFVDKLK